MAEYYDGTKLLSLMDINGNKPEIYIVTTNRTGGKTTYFGRYFVNRFLKFGEKFVLLYRYKYELSDCATKFFKDIQGLFFSNYDMTSKLKAGGIFHELFLNDVSCGYCVAINSADGIKKYSHLFSDCKRILFDEFQCENGQYCPKEVDKFMSIHTSIARGQGEQSKYLPVFMLANPVSLINPYYTAWGISARLQKETKFMRGVGFVMEQGFVESASQAQKSSGFNQAFANSNYMQYANESKYLLDNHAFIEKPTGKAKYLMTLKYDDKYYSIKEYSESGYVYCDDTADMTFPLKIVVTASDHDINYIMLKNNSFVIANLRYYFEKGCFRFKNLDCKNVVLTALSY